MDAIQPLREIIGNFSPMKANFGGTVQFEPGFAGKLHIYTGLAIEIP
ncbi:hypothetical protein QPR87_15305 [Paracoccus sp. SSJ]|jgi:hypothetical protein|nr:hypothetical protein [Paracoccus sp. SSJ]